MTVQSTTNYSMFKFRNDNREKGICQSHVNKLVASISSKNMLDMRPISVNKDMEILDGQHRLKAAEQLQIPIFYILTKDIKPIDMLLLNTNKSWSVKDFFNFYVKNKYPEYIKLNEFITKNDIPLNVGISLVNGRAHRFSMDFRMGEFKFKPDILMTELETCWETIEYIKKMNGVSQSRYTGNPSFWRSLIKLIQCNQFNAEKWRSNVRMFVDRFAAKANQQDYMKMLLDIYNWKSHQKISMDQL